MAEGQGARLSEDFESFFEAHRDALKLLSPKEAGWRYYQAGAAFGAGDERLALAAENAELRAALEWYADLATWEVHVRPLVAGTWSWRAIDNEGGVRARAALTVRADGGA